MSPQELADELAQLIEALRVSTAETAQSIEDLTDINARSIHTLADLERVEGLIRELPDPTPSDLERRLQPLRGRHLLGASAQPGTIQAFRALEALVGTALQARRVFLGGDTEFELDTSAGRVPIVEVAIGSDYERMAERVGALDPYPVVLTVGHEEERRDKNRTASWFLENYYTALPILLQAPNAIVGTTWMLYSMRGQNDYVGSGNEFLEWLPQPGDCHFLGVDMYVHDTTKAINAPNAQLKWPLAYAEHLNVPLIMGEFGVAGTATQRSDYVQDYLDFVAALHSHPDMAPYAPLITSWFHSKRGGNPPLTFDGSRTWEIHKASDREDNLTPAVWKGNIEGQ